MAACKCFNTTVRIVDHLHLSILSHALAIFISLLRDLMHHSLVLMEGAKCMYVRRGKSSSYQR